MNISFHMAARGYTLILPDKKTVILGTVITVDVAASTLRSGLSSGKTVLRRQFEHKPLQAKTGF
jgi:hypothetical protein